MPLLAWCVRVVIETVQKLSKSYSDGTETVHVTRLRKTLASSP